MNTKVKRAEKLIKGGMTVEKAAKQVGISLGTIYGHRKKSDVKVHQFPKRRSGRLKTKGSGMVMVVYGTPSQVM